MDTMFLLLFIIGSVIGSFLNVIIYRLPLNISIISPRSFCIKCNKTIPFYRNIPILSYIFQKGKCAECNKHISIQYPLVELIIALNLMFSFYNYLFPEFLFYFFVSSILICICIIDYNYFIIPLSLVVSTLIILLIYIIYLSTNPIYHIYGMLIGTGYLSFIFIITWIATKKQPLGFGDLQLIIILGLFLGPLKILITIFLAAILGITFWIYLSFKNGYRKNLKLPFGTFLCIIAIFIYIVPLNWKLFNFI